MVEPSAPSTLRPPDALLAGAVCPYLLADGGAWRSAHPHRAHRCAAVEPPAILAADKQRRLCLTADHTGCATFAAARAIRDGVAAPAGNATVRPTARPVARTAPLLLDHARIALTPAPVALRLDRSIGQAVLVGLMVLAFAAILIARLTAGDGPAAGVAGATGTPAPSASAAVEATPVPTGSGASELPTEPAATPAPSAGQPTDAPDPTGPDATPATYTVRSGDTLVGIAGRFDTTWQVLAELNDIEDPGRLRVGQELTLP